MNRLVLLLLVIASVLVVGCSEPAAETPEGTTAGADAPQLPAEPQGSPEL